MTSDEVEALIQAKTRNTVRIRRLEERVGDSVGFLRYSIDDQNSMTIWHTEVSPSLQNVGLGGKLVEEALQLASRDSSHLRIVCPFANEHLARHPELKGRYSVAAQAVTSDEKSLSTRQTIPGGRLPDSSEICGDICQRIAKITSGTAAPEHTRRDE